MPATDERRAQYESWVRQYSTDIFRCAYRLCGDGDSAEELTQETFYEAWRSVNTLRNPEKARYWLLGILRHRYMHWLHDQKRGPSSSIDAQERAEQISSGQDAPGELIERQESLQAALDALQERYKVPFLLVFLEGMTCQQTADMLKLPLGTVLSRIHRGRQFLRGFLEQEQSPVVRMKIHRGEPDSLQPPTGTGGAT